MNAALALDDPVLVIEHVDLYGQSRRDPGGRPRLPAAVRQGRAPPGRVRTSRCISYLSMVRPQPRGDRADRNRRRADRPALARPGIASTGRRSARASRRPTPCSSSSRAPQGTSYGGWLADEIQRRFFDWLDQPVQRVTGGEASPSISKVLERAAIAKTEEVVAGLERVRARLGRQLMASSCGCRKCWPDATEAAMQSWLVAPGRRVAVGQPLAEIETEKAIVEYEAEAEGTSPAARRRRASGRGRRPDRGARRPEGETDADIDAALASERRHRLRRGGTRRGRPAPALAASAVPPAAPVQPAAAAVAPTPAAAPARPAGARIFASPLVRRLARERGSTSPP